VVGNAISTSKFHSAGGGECDFDLKIPFSRWSGMRFRPQNSIQQVVENAISTSKFHSAGGGECDFDLKIPFCKWCEMRF